MRPLLPLIALVLTIGLAGCPKHPVRGSSPGDWPEPDPEMLREVLGPGDVFEVRVFEEESLTDSYRVEADGHFVYPLLGRIEVTGRTATELAEFIRGGLADGFMVAPQVTVFVEEFNSRKVSVLGEVRNPGRYTYRPGMTLVEAIAEAGGTTESSVVATMRVTRRRDEGEISMEIPFKEITQGQVKDFPLSPGDIVFVAESAVK